jgi:hypothetical protein
VVSVADLVCVVEVELSDGNLPLKPAMLAKTIPPMISQTILDRDRFLGWESSRAILVVFNDDGPGDCRLPHDWQNSASCLTNEPQF